ncbi:hypothetical protein C8Q75DRAFT_812065 [Abortiporus biennis]|nr:hypothetical protein C8Q75DRAFT_812065 [Abortiporus biennis]
MPILTRPGDQETQTCQVILSNIRAIQFIFNAQHDCDKAKCDVKDVDPVIQDRRETSLRQGAVVHQGAEWYLLNMHALHNAHLIRKVLPRSLTTPVPYFTNRGNKHREFASSLRVAGPVKRAATQAKAKETHEARKNKAKQDEEAGESDRS